MFNKVIEILEKDYAYNSKNDCGFSEFQKLLIKDVIDIVSNRFEQQVIKNEQANKDNANVTTADKFSNDFIYAKDGWHEIFQFCLANGMDRVLEQYPQEQHNTGVKAVKLFIHHLIGAKLDSSGSL